jgi:hypothetical protein
MMRKFNDHEIPVDVLRMIINKSRKYSLIILVNGHGQVGKTTFIRHLCCRIEQIRRGLLNPNDPRITWREWDEDKFTATSAQDFVRIWNDNDGAVMTLAEASTTLYYMDWMQVMARVFNSTTTTQGLKRNICILDTVMATEIMKKAKEKVDFRIWVAKRYDAARLCITRNYWVEINYAKDKWRLRWLPDWILRYSPKELCICKDYTRKIAETLKADEARLNEQRVGLLPYHKPYDPSKPYSKDNMEDWMRELL